MIRAIVTAVLVVACMTISVLYLWSGNDIQSIWWMVLALIWRVHFLDLEAR